jgi:hypothetical protein
VEIVRALGGIDRAKDEIGAFDGDRLSVELGLPTGVPGVAEHDVAGLLHLGPEHNFLGIVSQDRNVRGGKGGIRLSWYWRSFVLSRIGMQQYHLGGVEGGIGHCRDSLCVLFQDAGLVDYVCSREGIHGLVYLDVSRMDLLKSAS